MYYRKGNHKKNKIVMFVFILLIFTDIFTYSQSRLKDISESGVLPMVVPFIRVSESVSLTLWFVLFLGLFIVFLLPKKGIIKIASSPFGMFLIYRLLTMVLQMTFSVLTGNEGAIRWGNYFLWCIELLIYYTCLISYADDTVFIYIKIIKIATFVISIETIWQSVLGVLPKVSYLSTWYKSCLNIPLGSSNSLAAMIVPCVAAVLYDREKFDLKKIIFLLVNCSAVFLTKSRMSILILLFAVLVYLFKSPGSHFAGKVAVGAAGIIFAILFAVKYTQEIGIVIYGFADYVEGGGIINKLSSGRITIFKHYFNEILSHPLFGNGPNYASSRAHNIVVDLLYQNGIVGFTIFAYAIYKIVFKDGRYKCGLEGQRFLFIYMVMQLVNSLGEISFFTNRVCDLFFIPMIVYIEMGLKNENTLRNR